LFPVLTIGGLVCGGAAPPKIEQLPPGGTFGLIPAPIPTPKFAKWAAEAREVEGHVVTQAGVEDFVLDDVLDKSLVDGQLVNGTVVCGKVRKRSGEETACTSPKVIEDLEVPLG
jgi:hypothetical protein